MISTEQIREDYRRLLEEYEELQSRWKGVGLDNTEMNRVEEIEAEIGILQRELNRRESGGRK